MTTQPKQATPRTLVSDGGLPDDTAQGHRFDLADGKNTGQENGHPRPLDGFRADLVTEMLAMTRHLLSDGGQIDPHTLKAIRRIDAGESVPLDELCVAHANISAQVAPSTPRAIRALADGRRQGALLVFLGPTAEVRRISLATVFFALLFFGISLMPAINHQTIALSIYEQSGFNLLVKLIFLLAAAGLGASFGALFEVWREISEGRFDPISESAHWMRICLGIVAGLVLSEIVSADIGLNPTGADGGAPPITEALLALVGGFSAGLLHLVVTRLVKAVENIFTPADPGARQVRRPVAAPQDLETPTRTKDRP